MKKQENQMIHIQVKSVNRPKYEKNNTFVGWLCRCVMLCLLLLTIVLFFLNIFPLQRVMEWGKLLLGLFLITLWTSVIYINKKTMTIMLPLTWLMIGLFVGRYWQWLWLCIQNLVDAVLIQVNQYHLTNHMLWRAAKVPSSGLVLAFIAPISLWSGYYVVRRPIAGLALLPAILIGIGGLYVGEFVQLGGAALFVMVFYTLRGMRAGGTQGIGLFYSSFTSVMVLIGFIVVYVIVRLFVASGLEEQQTFLVNKQAQIIEKIKNGEVFEDNIIEEIVSNFRSETARLSNAGPVFTGRKVLKVTVEKVPSSMLYLRGFVGETYHNNQWESIDEAAFEKNWKETDGITLQNLPYDLFLENNRPIWVTIDGIGLRENYAYAPYYVRYSDEFKAYGDGSVSKPPTDPYTFYGFPYEDIIKIQGTAQGRKAYWESEYQKYVRQVYLELPEELAELKSECRATGLYGQEDLVQIQYYVRERLCLFEYSQQLDPLPEGEDYILYFLYRQQKGFCEHFASASVAMYRALGIPARYVSGYAVPSDAFDEDGYAEVLDYMGHAWAEIYVDDAGWMRVDCTPSVDENPLYGGLPEEEESSVQENSREESSREVSSREESSKQESSRGENIGNMGNSKDESSKPIALIPGGNHGNGGELLDWSGIFEKIANVLIILLIPTLLIMLVCLRRLLVLSARTNSGEQVDYRPQIRRLGRQFFAVLRFSHYPKNSHNMTDEEFTDQLLKELSLPAIRMVLPLLEEATYGGLAMSEEEYREVLRGFDRLVNTLWQEWNLFKRFWAKWVRCWK